MKPVYLYEFGVSPWEQPKSVSDDKYSTLTILHRSISDLFSLWVEVVAVLITKLPNTMKWRSLGYPIKGSKFLEYKILQDFTSDLSESDFLNRNEKTGVYSYVEKITEPIFNFDLNSIAQSRYTMLLFSSDLSPNLSEVWSLCQDSDVGINANTLVTILEDLKNLAICRVTESDTHSSVQFIGDISMVEKLLNRVCELGLERVFEHEVFDFIN